MKTTSAIPLAAVFLIAGCAAKIPPATSPATQIAQVAEETPKSFFLNYRMQCGRAAPAELVGYYERSSDPRETLTLAEIDAARGHFLAAVRDHWGSAAADHEAVAFQFDGPADDATAVVEKAGDPFIVFARKDVHRLELVRQNGALKMGVDEGYFESGAFALVFSLLGTDPFNHATEGIRSGRLHSPEEVEAAVNAEMKTISDTFNGS